jgi:uncharacterized protein involved in exopolysaccharide biosynthesis
MKRILKLMARLYPSDWRKRYGVEYEALIDDSAPRASDSFDVAWGAIKMRLASRDLVRVVLPCALAGMLAAVGVSFARPRVYRSRTLISVDTSDRWSLDRQLAGEARELVTEPILTTIIEKQNLYSTERARMPLGDVVQIMRKNILIWPVQTSDGKAAPAFILEFMDPDAHAAQRVDGDLVSEFTAMHLRAAVADPSAVSAHTTFTVREAPNLPQKPFLPNRGEFGAGGLLGGFGAGLILTMVLARGRGDVLNPEV